MNLFKASTKATTKPIYRTQITTRMNNRTPASRIINTIKNTIATKRTTSTALISRKFYSTNKQYIECENSHVNTCMNNGTCYITNPNLYKSVEQYNRFKIQFCM